MDYILYILLYTFNFVLFTHQNSTQFNCLLNNQTALETEQSVHKLKPSQIKVIAALGDSITAAAGANAKTSLGLLLENREVSWSMGGKSTLNKVVTLPNILKKFNPKLIGFSTSSSFIINSKTGFGFNAAVSGQEARHLHKQAKTLIKRLKESKSIDFNNDWKLITILIGNNDICDYCKDKELHTPQAYINFIQEALDLLHNELPKTFVNLVNVINVAEVEFLNFRLFCKNIHKATCPCIVKYTSNETKIQVQNLFNQYSNYTEKLALSGRYDTRDDFTVVYQPFLRDFKLPKMDNYQVDKSYFAPDCFHFSAKSHGNFKLLT